MRDRLWQQRLSGGLLGTLLVAFACSSVETPKPLESGSTSGFGGASSSTTGTDGSTVTTGTDGSTVTSGTDGSTVTSGSNGTVTSSTDGSTTTTATNAAATSSTDGSTTATSTSAGGASTVSTVSTTGDASTTMGGASTADTTGETGATTTGGIVTGCNVACSNADAGSCSSPQVRLTDVSLPAAVINGTGQSDTEQLPMAISAIPSGGSRLAWLTPDEQIYVAQLDCEDQIVGTPFSLPAHDLQDIYGEDDGGVIALTRDAEGGGTLNCGTPANLCDGGPNPAIPCYDSYLVRFDCDGNQNWATKLTNSSASLPPYSTGPNGPTVNMIWWYQNHGRIASDGTNYATYFCNAISISQGGCINIHEGDRMQVVGPSGSIVNHPNAFEGGCSHSWTTRITYDDRSDEFVTVCATDNQNRIARSPNYQTIMDTPDTGTSRVGNLILGSSSGYWVSVAESGAVHLLHFEQASPDQDIQVASAADSHLASYGASNMVIAWGSGGGLTAQVRDAGSGSQVGSDFSIDVTDHQYQAMKAFPDGSVAFAGRGSGNQTIRIARVMPCSG